MSSYQIVSKWNLSKKIEVLSIQPTNKTQHSNKRKSSQKNSISIGALVGCFAFFMIVLYLSIPSPSYHSNEQENEQEVEQLSVENNNQIENSSSNSDVIAEKQKTNITKIEKPHHTQNSDVTNQKKKNTNETIQNNSDSTLPESKNNAAKDLTSLSGL